jgi:hypothetical protein
MNTRGWKLRLVGFVALAATVTGLLALVLAAGADGIGPG